MLAMLLFKQLIQLFIIMVMGMLLVRTHILKASDSRILSLVCIYLIIPCLVLNSFQIGYTPEIRNGFFLAVLAAIIVHIIFIILTAILRKFFNLTRIERASVIYSNCGNLIIPLVTALLGKEWIIYCSGYMMVQTILVWTHGVSLISGQRKLEWKKIVTNLNLIVILVSLFLFLCQIRLPSIALGVVDTVGSTIGPISMIMIGMLLGEANWKKVFTNPRLYGITFLRLIAVPAITILIIKYSGLSSLVPGGKQILMLTSLAAAAPAAATVTQLSQLYEVEEEYCGTINVMTTTLCVLTMPIMIALYQM